MTEATVNSELTVRTEGSRQVRREIKRYDLDMILAVGYRVTTPRAAQFRQWATTVLSEYLIKGFAMQDERLKGAQTADYFEELLARIRDIRASEKRLYQKVRDIFVTTSADYSPASTVAKPFFATIQNKLLYAVTGHTAGEPVVARADAASPSMGLTAWPGRQVRKSDVMVAKNYLTEDEVTELNRLTTMFLDCAEDRARRRQQILMTEWAERTDAFLTFNERDVLTKAPVGIAVNAPDIRRTLRSEGNLLIRPAAGLGRRGRRRGRSGRARLAPGRWVRPCGLGDLHAGVA